MEQIALNEIAVSETNPTARVLELNGLVDSIRLHGVLQPIVVRPASGAKAKKTPYELVCGHRRHAAAGEAGLEKIPAIVRSLNDEEALELQIIENLQRQDLHPLDEAQAYALLRTQHKQDVAHIAERVGRSVPYIYSRLRFLDLTPEAQEHFRAGRITPGHAVVLSQLKPEIQKRAFTDDSRPIFEEDRTLWDDDSDPKKSPPMRTCPVHELQEWVNSVVKLDLKSPELLDLFPDTAAAVAGATEQHVKIIPITYDWSAPAGVLGNSYWRRADGKNGSKTCDRSGIGVAVIGHRRGSSIRVCASQDCPTHWPGAKQLPGAKPSAKPNSKAPASSKPKQDPRKQQMDRWSKAEPAIMKAVAVALAKVPASATSALGKFLVKDRSMFVDRDLVKHVPAPGKTADDLVRYLGFAIIIGDALDSYEPWEALQVQLKAAGVSLNVTKIIDEAAPPVAPKTVAKAAAKKKKSAGDGKCADCGTGFSSNWHKQTRGKTDVSVCADCHRKPAKASTPKKPAAKKKARRK